MITNHGFGHVIHLAVFLKIVQLTKTKRWQAGLGLLKRFVNKLFLFICLESVLAASIFLGTGYIFVLN